MGDLGAAVGFSGVSGRAVSFGVGFGSGELASFLTSIRGIFNRSFSGGFFVSDTVSLFCTSSTDPGGKKSF